MAVTRRHETCAAVKSRTKTRPSALKYSTKNLPRPYMTSVAARVNPLLSALPDPNKTGSFIFTRFGVVTGKTLQDSAGIAWTVRNTSRTMVLHIFRTHKIYHKIAALYKNFFFELSNALFVIC